MSLFSSLTNSRGRAVRSGLLVWFSLIAFAHALPVNVGDLDEDGEQTVLDLALLAGHLEGTRPLSAALTLFADLTQDGVLNGDDQQALLRLVVQAENPQALPLAGVRFTTPADGEGDVAVTRETVVHFTLPLSLSSTLDTTKFRAEFGGRKILSRVDLSSDRKKATLFYLEPLPSSARVQVTLDGTGLTDLLGRPVALGPPPPGAPPSSSGPFSLSFDTISITPVAATAIKGRVLASKPALTATGQPLDTPLAGVTITVDGAEQTLRTTTDAAGNFTLSPCPAGSFFIHVDGRTSPSSSWPNGDYYPTVGKRWEAIAGRTDNLAGNSEDTTRGTIYLPCVCAGTLKTVSPTQDTKIAFPASVLAEYPALAGTELIVPANSLFADDGTRGGKVGIAPVPPTRLPSPLPPGLNLPMVITIQSDGATNFDRPVPVSFPNIPDPITGQRLAPGTKSALWSFNHDLGSWEIAGAMTVTDDGLFVKTDAGVGVRQPGWHGTQPGSSTSTTPQPSGPHTPPPSGPFGPCSDGNSGPSNYQRRGACIQAGIAGVTAGVIARNVVCRVPGAAFWAKFLCGQAMNRIPVTDPILAARNSRDCQQFYLDCDLNAGERRSPRNNNIDPVISNRVLNLLEGLSSDLEEIVELENMAVAVLAGASSIEQLTADQISALKDLERAHSLITSNKSEDAQFGPVLSELSRLAVALDKAAGNKPSELLPFYLLENAVNNFVQRGRLPSSRKLSDIPLAASTHYVIYLFTPGFLNYQALEFKSAANGQNTQLPIFGNFLFSKDTDLDGLFDEAEKIIGTNPNNPDSDADGISDGVEV